MMPGSPCDKTHKDVEARYLAQGYDEEAFILLAR